MGGGSKSALWRQMIADALQVRVVVPAAPETAALGAALQAVAMRAGVSEVGDDMGAWIAINHGVPLDAVVVPDAGKREAYDEAFRAYEERGQRLFGDPES